MQPTHPSAPQDITGLANRLLDASWYDWGVDPSMLICLTINDQALQNTTVFGKKLYSLVLGIVGEGNKQNLHLIVKEIERIFVSKWAPSPLHAPAAHLPTLRVVPGRWDSDCPPTGKGLNATGRYTSADVGGAISVWEGKFKQEVIEKMCKAHKGQIPTFCMAQFVRHDKRRFFRGYAHPQDMVRDVSRILVTPRCPFTHILETPVNREGVVKLYFDVEYYLKKMEFIDGCTREERVSELLEIANELPAILSRALIDIKLVNQDDRRCIVVKDNSREIEGGDYKVARHFVFDILLTSQMRETVMGDFFKWIQKSCPMVARKMQKQGEHITAKEYAALLNKDYVCLAGIDTAGFGSMQSLRFAWTRKSVDSSLLSLHSTVWVRNGSVVQGPATSSAAYTPVPELQSAPQIALGVAAAALWDSCITIPSPRCMPVNKYAIRGSLKRGWSHADGQGACKRRRCGGWHDIKCSWFVEWCKRQCNNNLPSMNTNVPYATPPEGFEEAAVFQINSSNINVCSMSMMEIPCVPRHIHKSNGTVFCVLGDTVLVKCLDPVCTKRLWNMGAYWKNMSRTHPEALHHDDRMQGAGQKGWWARIPKQ